MKRLLHSPAAVATMEAPEAQRDIPDMGRDLWNRSYYPTGPDAAALHKEWFIVDATGQTLGRLAVLVSTYIRSGFCPFPQHVCRAMRGIVSAVYGPCCNAVFLWLSQCNKTSFRAFVTAAWQLATCEAYGWIPQPWQLMSEGTWVAESCICLVVLTCLTAARRGKHRPTYTPSVDMGGFVVVINAEKVIAKPLP